MIACLCPSQAHSADAAISQAKGSGDVAAMGKTKIILQGIGAICGKQEGNRSRDLATHLHRRGFMLNIPITWLKQVPWGKDMFAYSTFGTPSG